MGRSVGQGKWEKRAEYIEDNTDANPLAWRCHRPLLRNTLQNNLIINHIHAERVSPLYILSQLLSDSPFEIAHLG